MKFLISMSRNTIGNSSIYTYKDVKNLKRYALNKKAHLKNWYSVEVWNNPDRFYDIPDQVIYNPDYID